MNKPDLERMLEILDKNRDTFITGDMLHTILEAILEEVETPKEDN